MLEEDEKISWSDRVRNEDVLRRVKEERNILHTMKRRKANWIGHIFYCCAVHFDNTKILFTNKCIPLLHI